MSFKVLAVAFLLPLVVSSAMAQVPVHLKGEVQWNPFDPKRTLDHPQESANEHEEQDSNPDQGIVDGEENQN